MSIRMENKFKVLITLKNAELCIEDVCMYSDLDHLRVIPVLSDLCRWGEVKNIGEEINSYTKKKRKTYATTEKGERKIQYLKERYGFTWKPNRI
jgi:DNA-binding PadR family transcriptional regulator